MHIRGIRLPVSLYRSPPPSRNIALHFSIRLRKPPRPVPVTGCPAIAFPVTFHINNRPSAESRFRPYSPAKAQPANRITIAKNGTATFLYLIYMAFVFSHPIRSAQYTIRKPQPPPSSRPAHPAARVRRHLYQEQFRTERFLLFVGDLLRVSGYLPHCATRVTTPCSPRGPYRR